MGRTSHHVVVACALGVTLPSIAHADDAEDGRAALLAVGYSAQSALTGVAVDGWVYPASHNAVINSWYIVADATFAGPGFSFDTGLRVFRKLTIGINGGFFPTNVTGPAAPKTGQDTIGGVGLSIGWLVQTPRFLVHPIVFAQRAGNEPNYGARWGLEVHAIAGIVRWGSVMGLPLWVTAYADVGASTSTIATATYHRTFATIGVTPIDVTF